jgi:transposase
VALVTGYNIKHSLGNLKGKNDLLDAQRIREYALRFKDKLIFQKPKNVVLQELKNCLTLEANW